MLGPVEGRRVRVEVGGLAEELSAETLVGVDENAVLVAVVGGRGVLAEEGSLPDEVAALGALGAGALLGGAVVDAAELIGGLLNLHDGEGGAEGVASQGAVVVEEVVEAGERGVGPLLVDLREHDGAAWDGLLDLSEVALPVIGDAASNGAGEAELLTKFMMLE